jgi:hypothetical protein
MPDDVAIDKVLVLEKLGAKVERVRPGMSTPWECQSVSTGVLMPQLASWTRSRYVPDLRSQ